MARGHSPVTQGLSLLGPSFAQSSFWILKKISETDLTFLFEAP